MNTQIEKLKNRIQIILNQNYMAKEDYENVKELQEEYERLLKLEQPTK